MNSPGQRDLDIAVACGEQLRHVTALTSVWITRNYQELRGIATRGQIYFDICRYLVQDKKVRSICLLYFAWLPWPLSRACTFEFRPDLFFLLNMEFVLFLSNLIGLLMFRNKACAPVFLEQIKLIVFSGFYRLLFGWPRLKFYADPSVTNLRQYVIVTHDVWLLIMVTNTALTTLLNSFISWWQFLTGLDKIVEYNKVITAKKANTMSVLLP